MEPPDQIGVESDIIRAEAKLLKTDVAHPQTQDDNVSNTGYNYKQLFG